MKRKVVLLIDGGHVRALAKKAALRFEPALIERLAKHCLDADEELLRVLYYDCAPYAGTRRLPISGARTEFKGSDAWLRHLALKDLFAVRLGVLKFRGWDPKTIPAGSALTDGDFAPRFEQKGVDMRIGLDIASMSAQRFVDRLVLLTADTDFVPALKYARRAGLQVVLVDLPGHRLASELVMHADFRRQRNWPPVR